MPDTVLKTMEGHDDKWFHMSLGLKEGCPAAPIEFSIDHSFIMKDLKSRLLENPDGNIRVGFLKQRNSMIFRSSVKIRLQRRLDGQGKWNKRRSPSTSFCSQMIPQVCAEGQKCRTARRC